MVKLVILTKTDPNGVHVRAGPYDHFDWEYGMIFYTFFAIIEVYVYILGVKLMHAGCLGHVFYL
jgi:hypothetical protein